MFVGLLELVVKTLGWKLLGRSAHLQQETLLCGLPFLPGLPGYQCEFLEVGGPVVHRI